MNNMLMPPNMMPQQPVQPASPQGLLAQPGAFSGPQGAQQMSQMYGLLAQYADDPTRVGMDYVRSMQNQQMLDRQKRQDMQRMQEQEDPIARKMKIYGNINPYDWTAQSLERFDQLLDQGVWDMSVLESKTKMSGQLEKAMLGAEEKAIEASNSVTEFESLADRYMQAYRTGNFTQGGPGAIRQWLIRNVTGEYDSEAALIQDMQKFVNKRAIKDLPTGPATDRDLAIARQGYPPPNASPEYWASYLRGMQKAQVVDFAYQEHKYRWYAKHDSAKGQLQDWLKNRNVLIRDAYALHDLSEERVDAKYSNEEAAKIIAQRRGVYLPETITETYGTTGVGGPERGTVRPRVPARKGMYEKMTTDELIDAASSL